MIDTPVLTIFRTAHSWRTIHSSANVTGCVSSIIRKMYAQTGVRCQVTNNLIHHSNAGHGSTSQSSDVYFTLHCGPGGHRHHDSVYGYVEFLYVLFVLEYICKRIQQFCNIIIILIFKISNYGILIQSKWHPTEPGA